MFHKTLLALRALGQDRAQLRRRGELRIGNAGDVACRVDVEIHRLEWSSASGAVIATADSGELQLKLVASDADGIDPQLKQTADEAIRLSDMTLPHALARVLLLEQLYRAWSLRNNHPYHRA